MALVVRGLTAAAGLADTQEGGAKPGAATVAAARRAAAACDELLAQARLRTDFCLRRGSAPSE